MALDILSDHPILFAIGLIFYILFALCLGVSCFRDTKNEIELIKNDFGYATLYFLLACLFGLLWPLLVAVALLVWIVSTSITYLCGPDMDFKSCCGINFPGYRGLSQQDDSAPAGAAANEDVEAAAGTEATQPRAEGSMELPSYTGPSSESSSEPPPSYPQACTDGQK
ncbi:hypothetical protein B0T16DRAFT_409406 [Cercophora newfieldiana]|uniref:Transmembrane protein n=1 Tax=Cercophora newfieldiana TaxID=92897 RepID=A0AA39YAL4_9PEZI|nr:hypothetical protein B0T16DRAFT_409406 [Cercophora newfieldiana]